MIKLNTYIQEKFLLDQDYEEEKRDLSKVNYYNVQKEIDSISWRDSQNHLEKVRYYKDKNSNPQRLVNSIKTKNKLVIRWYLSIMEDWLECAKIFRQAIIDRGYFNADELDAYILKRYNSYFGGTDFKKIFAKYLDEFGVDRK